MRKTTTVPIGPTTVGGAATAAVAFVLAVIAYFTGPSAEHTTALELASGGLLTALVVIAGRYFQAHKQIGADLEQVEHGLGLTTAQVEALVEQKLPELLPMILANIGKAVAGAQATAMPPHRAEDATV